MNFFDKVRGIVKKDYSLKHLTWFKIGGSAEYFFKPYDLNDLVELLRENNGVLPHFTIGAGSNLLIRDCGIDGIVIKLGRNFNNIGLSESGKNLSVGAGCLNSNLAKFCQLNSIKNFEFLVGIPGTVGGGVAMNAGAYGSDFSDIVVFVEALDKFGNRLLFSNKEIGFLYRSNSLQSDVIFTNVIFKLEFGDKDLITNRMQFIQDTRSKTQPIKEKTCGSVFANPKSIKAWKLIDNLGFRGMKIGDVSISSLHSNFMINHGSATAKDVELLGQFIQDKAKEVANIDLHWEIRKIGNERKIINTNPL